MPETNIQNGPEIAEPLIGIGWASIVSLPFAIVSQKVSQARMGLFNLSVGCHNRWSAWVWR